jgi:hypothetical protein
VPVLIVDGDTVTRGEIISATDIFRRQQVVLMPERLFDGNDAELMRGAARGIAANILMLREIHARQWVPDPARVEAMAAMFIGQFPSREVFLEQLTAMGETEESMRLGMGEELMLDSLLRVVADSAVPPDESELRARYEANMERYMDPGRIRASHILFALEPTASDSQVQVAMRRAGEALERARAGEDFDKLIKEYSSPAPDLGDGDGWIRRGQLIPDFERLLFGMRKGDVGGPVPSGMGLHILKKTGEESPRQRTFEEVSGSIGRALLTERQNAAVNNYIARMLAAADIRFLDETLRFDLGLPPAVEAAGQADNTEPTEEAASSAEAESAVEG